MITFLFKVIYFMFIVFITKGVLGVLFEPKKITFFEALMFVGLVFLLKSF
jgi:hypothetical protein